MHNKKTIKILFMANANTSRIVAQDLNAKDLIAHLDDPFEIYIFNSGKGKIDPKCRKPNVHIIHRRTIFEKIIAAFLMVAKPMDYHFYIRSYQNRFYWWFKRLFCNHAKTIHPIEILLPYPAGRGYQRRAKRNALKSDYLFGLTDLINESVEKEYGRRVTGKIPIGVDTSIFKKMDIPRDRNRLRVLSVGRLQERKRPLFFIETARQFPNVDFAWIGDGPLRDTVVENARAVSNFERIAPIPHTELAKEMNLSDIFFFPSLHEGLPKVVLEAMACGLPPILFDTYKPEHVENGISGYIVNTDDEAIERLRTLIDSPDLRQRLGQAAIERAAAFSWESVAEQWKVFLKKTIKM